MIRNRPLAGQRRARVRPLSLSTPSVRSRPDPRSRERPRHTKAPTIQSIYARIKRLIAADTSRPANGLLAGHSLRKDCLYSSNDLHGLEQRLNTQFSDVAILPIIPGEFADNTKMATIRDWALGCWAKIPPRHKGRRA